MKVEHAEAAESQLADNQSKPDIFSLYILFYNIQVNLSANFLHRFLKIYECYQSHLYTQPYSTYGVNQSRLAETVEDLEPANHRKQKIQIDSLARRFEKYLPLLKQSFVFKEPIIKFHPYSHFPLVTHVGV